MPDNMIKLGDFKDIESKELVEKEIFRRIKPSAGSWRNRCYIKKLAAPYKSCSFRTVVYPKAPDESGIILQEGITPDPTGRLAYIEQTLNVVPRGFYSTYTDEDLTYGFDNIVGDLTNSISNQAEGVLDQIAANAFASGNNVWLAPTGITREIFIKIRIALVKFTQKKNPVIKAVLTPEDISELRLAYNKAGANLFQDLDMNKDSVVDGAIAKFEGCYIEEDSSDIMYGEGGKRYAFFYTEDSEGRKPVGFVQADGETAEFIAKGLGSSGTEDALNQRGSIGVKFKGTGAQLTAEECLARVEITPRTTDGIEKVDATFNYITGNPMLNGEALPINGLRDTKTSPALELASSNVNISLAGTKTSTITAKDANGTTVTGFKLTSVNPSIATVSGTTVTGVKVGKAVIVAEKDGLAGLITVEVKA